MRQQWQYRAGRVFTEHMSHEGVYSEDQSYTHASSPYRMPKPYPAFICVPLVNNYLYSKSVIYGLFLFQSVHRPYIKWLKST